MRATSRCGRLAALLGVLAIATGCASADRKRATNRTEPEASAPHFGEEMERIGRRFERLGRAGVVRRWELARYELHEIEEGVEALGGATPPEDLVGADLHGLAEGFVARALPTLDSALASRDTAAFSTAFREVARECNACHQAIGRAFIQVPEVPGAEVPILTPAHGEDRR
jgi:hypothetical protein